MNSISIVGNVCADAENGTTSSGKMYSRFSVAVTRPFQRDKTDFFNCVAWGALAEKVISKYVKKGIKVGLTGSIEFKRDESDSRIVYHTVVVDKFELLSKGAGSENAVQDSVSAPASAMTEVPDEDDMPF